MGERQPTIAVFGSSTARPGDETYGLGLELGAALARAGAAVMTGGYGGVMEACSRGASEAGGHVVGVTVELFERRGPVNRWVNERLHTSDLFERLRTLVDRADGFIAAPGSVGTMTELFLAWTLISVRAHAAPPVVLLGPSWERWLESHRAPGLVPAHLFDHVRATASVPEAVRLVLDGTHAPERSRS